MTNKDETYTSEEQDVMSGLDPLLQHVLLSKRTGRIDRALVQEASDGSLRVDVTAVLRNPNEHVPGLEVGQRVGNIVTGSCEIENIESVRTDPNVISLKGATRVEPNLRFSVPEIRGSRNIIQETLPPGAVVPDGAGVIVGIVDFGCDFAHQNFRNPDGTTRLLFLWDQTGPKTSMSPAGYPYGREFTSKEINDALHSDKPYDFISYDPGDFAHGTHVMDIAAGNGRGTGSPGVASNADLIFVELSVESLRPDESFGNSRRLMEAVKYIFDKASALGRRAVVNLSLGTHGGPHDGSTPVERWFDELLKTPDRAIVISAGNSRQRRSHSAGQVSPGNRRTLSWEKFAGDTTGNELELWYTGNSELEVTLAFPDGQRIGPVTLGGKTRLIKNAAGDVVGQIIHRAKDPLNGDNVINIFIGRELPSGVWGVELNAVSTQPASYHAWIERDDDRRNPQGAIIRNQSKFVAADEDPTHTIGSISCGANTIVVGSYSGRTIPRDLSEFSSEGPTRDRKNKPEVSAPGQDILAAESKSIDRAISMSGTSMAAPHVTGLIAVMMQAARSSSTIGQIRQTVIAMARRNPPPDTNWDSRYGNGRIDVAACVLNQAPALPVTAAVALEAPTIGRTAEIPQLSRPLTQFFDTMVNGSHNSLVRVTFEIDVNRQST